MCFHELIQFLISNGHGGNTGVIRIMRAYDSINANIPAVMQYEHAVRFQCVHHVTDCMQIPIIPVDYIIIPFQEIQACPMSDNEIKYAITVNDVHI